MPDLEDLLPGMDPGVAERVAVGCADCARSDSAAADMTPIDHMPIPVEALTGFSDGVPLLSGGEARPGLRRSTFLRNGAIGFASVYAASKIDWTRAFEAAQAEAQGAPTQIVMIFLNGGMDGLNAVVPTEAGQYATYLAKRPGLARVLGPSTAAAVGTTVLPNTNGAFSFANVGVTGTGNNDALKGFDSIYGDGLGGVGSDLAIFPSTDYNPPNLSHFDSREYWFSGALQKMTTGWLGRWLDTYGSLDNPLQAISLGSGVSKQIRAAKAPVSAVSSLNGIQFSVDGVSANTAKPTDEMAALAAVPVGTGNEALARSRGAYGQTVQVSRSLSGLVPGAAPPGYPVSDLSTRLQLAANLLSANLGTRVITLDWGSFDTHSNQIQSQDPQLKVLSAALAAFKDDLTTRGIENRVLTVVFSEFGRRIEQNENGTDHGAGGLMMAMGSSVVGGMRGELPSLASPDRNGDLVVTTDFRSVYRSLIGEWLGGDPGKILGDVPALSGALVG
jgi:uncharacterized protein (DUF1501 family)